MTFGGRVKAAREALDWTQAELAKKAGLPAASGQQTIAWIEKNKATRSKFAQQIADALGADITHLLTGRPSNRPPYRLPDRLALQMSLVPKDAQHRLEHLIEAYLKGEELVAIKPKRLHAVTGGKK